MSEEINNRNRNNRIRKLETIWRIRAILAQRHPFLIRQRGSKKLKVPMKKCIMADLIALNPDINAFEMKLFVSHYARKTSYQLALVQPNAMRLDLNGVPTEPVKFEEQKYALHIIKERLRKRPKFLAKFWNKHSAIFNALDRATGNETWLHTMSSSNMPISGGA